MDQLIDSIVHEVNTTESDGIKPSMVFHPANDLTVVVIFIVYELYFSTIVRFATTSMYFHFLCLWAQTYKTVSIGFEIFQPSTNISFNRRILKEFQSKPCRYKVVMISSSLHSLLKQICNPTTDDNKHLSNVNVKTKH